MPAIDFRFNYSMQHWQSPSDAVVKCKWDKLHLDAHKKLIASAVCICLLCARRTTSPDKKNKKQAHVSKAVIHPTEVGWNWDDIWLCRRLILTHFVFTCLEITFGRSRLMQPHEKLPSGYLLSWPVSVSAAKRCFMHCDFWLHTRPIMLC